MLNGAVDFLVNAECQVRDVFNRSEAFDVKPENIYFSLLCSRQMLEKGVLRETRGRRPLLTAESEVNGD